MDEFEKKISKIVYLTISIGAIFGMLCAIGMQ